MASRGNGHELGGDEFPLCSCGHTDADDEPTDGVAVHRKVFARPSTKCSGRWNLPTPTTSPNARNPTHRSGGHHWGGGQAMRTGVARASDRMAGAEVDKREPDAGAVDLG